MANIRPSESSRNAVMTVSRGRCGGVQFGRRAVAVPRRLKLGADVEIAGGIDVGWLGVGILNDSNTAQDQRAVVGAISPSMPSC
jgi:hypothetical protein